MALGTTQLADVIVPEIFTPYAQQMTEEKTRVVTAGALVRDAMADELLAGGGLTFHMPSWKDLDDDDDNVSSDDIPDRVALSASGAIPALPGAFNDSLPMKIESDEEIAVRLSRNQSWSAADLAGDLAGSDPMTAIGGRVGTYWAFKLQQAFIATWQGVSKDNAINDAGDYAVDIAGAAFQAGVTNFTAEAFIDATVTMGDSMDDLSIILVHSVVFARMQKNNLIDFIPDARGEVNIPTFQGHRVVKADKMPNGTAVVRADGSAGEAGIFESWIFGPGASRLGVGSPKVPTAVVRDEAAGNGGGVETLHNRVQWLIHPVGHSYVGTPPKGGPGNGTAVNQLNVDTSWNRVFSERKMIKFARLITREFA
jgi:hypothetical protein